MALETETELNAIVDRARVPWSKHNRTLRYKAALIIRNVCYRSWTLDTVEFELGMLVSHGEEEAKKLRQELKLVKRELQYAQRLLRRRKTSTKEAR